MSIYLPQGLPAADTLAAEGIAVCSGPSGEALRILLLNLMPTKIVTETQLCRLLGSTGEEVQVTFLRTATHESTHVDPAHMARFYKTFDQVRSQFFDGLIITGAPVEHMDFEQVDYWPELVSVMQWSMTHVRSTLYICWGAQAGLYCHYGIRKQALPEKLFGVFPHGVDAPQCPLYTGIPQGYPVPHSRHTTLSETQIRSHPELTVLSSFPEGGVYAVLAREGRQIFLTGHSEYDADTLEREYLRDKNLGLPIHVPQHYYPQDDDTRRPVLSWRKDAMQLYRNWLSYYVRPQ